jgi:23S rRNA (cytosine1962-C5)-methyltransferase
MNRSPRPVVRLRKALDRSVRSGHPWLYRDALERHEHPPGTAVRIVNKDGKAIGAGLVDAGPIGVRVWSAIDVPIDAALIAARLREALALRARVVPPETTAYRLLHGEGDRTPGVQCDRYENVAVLRFDAEGESLSGVREQLFEALREQLGAIGIDTLIERSSRRGGGMRLAWGELPPQPMVVIENGMKLAVDVVHGQKTGLFLDQREARARIRSLARGASLVNLYGYTGGFSIAAALGGARHVITVDIAPQALELAVKTFELNGVDGARHTTVASDVHEWLKAQAEQRARYDIVIADPPNFAPSEAAREAALASYAELHALALSVVEPGGYYVAGSCSSHIDSAAFVETLRAGAQRARKVVQVLDQHGAPPDHPRLLAFPEGEYLKVVLARVF